MTEIFDILQKTAKKRLPCENCKNTESATVTTIIDIKIFAVESKWTCSVCGWVLPDKD